MPALTPASSRSLSLPKVVLVVVVVTVVAAALIVGIVLGTKKSSPPGEKPGSPTKKEKERGDTTTRSPPLIIYNGTEPRPLVVPSGTEPGPHIILIVADDLGWNDVGFRYPGSNQMHTPNIDRLHQEGLNLMNSYMMPVCTPSRAAFLTGKYPFRYGMQSSVLSALDNASMPLSMTALPQQMKALGYTTHMIGKWHLGFCNPKMTPTGRGFDSFFGMYNGMSTYSTYLGKWDGFDLHDDANGTYRVASEWSGTYSTYLYSKKAVEVIEKHNKSKPLFLYLSYQAVHGPLEAPQSYINAYCANITGNDLEKRRTRCGMAAVMDEGIGNVTAALDRLGYTDDLVTVFFSDNGGPISEGSSNWPLRGGKITMWEGGTRVATIVHSKSHLPKVFQDKNAKQWDGLMHAVDWYPTLLRLAGYTSSIPGIDGVDNWRAIAEQKESGREWFVYNVNDEKGTSAIRYRNYKLLHNGGGSPDAWYMPPVGTNPRDAPAGKKPEYQLYDLRTDEGEISNIVDRTNVQDIVQKMKEELLKAESQIQKSVPYPSLDAGKPQNHDMKWVTGWC